MWRSKSMNSAASITITEYIIIISRKLVERIQCAHELCALRIECGSRRDT